MKTKQYLEHLGIPAVVSGLSLLASFIAIILLIQHHIALSILFAGLAFIFDILDGYVARKLHMASEVGRQLDSMVDLVNYSVYSALACALVLIPNWLGVFVGFVIIFTGILRLIRFNNEGYVETGDVRYYRGVVTCHLSLATALILLIDRVISIPQLLSAVILFTLALLQLSSIKTRKTGMTIFWVCVALLIVIGAQLWLK